ncbi:MAG: c-type cytochrome [Flavobacteriales bacterium]|nr:c-type cytochrome [Flavobacteriales bacterium]
MKQARRGILAIVLFAIGALACRKDEVILQEAASSGPTPLQLNVPAWAMAQIHPIYLPADNPLTVEGVALGRKLFYEEALSDDYTMSCASCHQQAHAFSDPRRFSPGTDGSLGRRNSMPVQNMLWDHFFFWDGRVGTLEEQAFKPVTNPVEMRNSWPVVEQRLRLLPDYPELFRRAFGTSAIDSVRIVRAIAQFERTLLSFESRFDRFYFGGDSSALDAQEKRGRNLFFNEAQCSQCHMLPNFQDHAFRNIGLAASPLDAGRAEVTGLSADREKFKVNSLRNIELTAPYMHDGRFATLEDVVRFYADSVVLSTPNLDNHMGAWTSGAMDLDEQERADLVAFLLTLTDPSFVTNPAFSDPD